MKRAQSSWSQILSQYRGTADDPSTGEVYAPAPFAALCGATF